MEAYKPKAFDFWIFITVLILLSLGVIMVISASAPYANNAFDDTWHIVRSQLLYAVIGIAFMLLLINVDYHIFGKFSTIILAISLIMLVAVLIPGIGRLENGARRWIYLGPLHFQPSEVAKISIIFFLSHKLGNREKPISYFFRDFLPYILLTGVIAILLMIEPHLSGTVITVCIITSILFSAGAKIRHFIIVSIPALAGFAYFIYTKSDYAMARLRSFLDPWSDMKGDGYQVVQSLYAIGSGGLFGRGLGRSMQKYLYLPYPHNDFIFSVLSEELGFIGVFAVLVLFTIFIWRGLRVAIYAKDLQGSLMAVGTTALIAVQMVLNVAVVSGWMPPTGVSLPLFSYGGTSLMLFLGAIGVLLNISRQVTK
ncbi:MAG: putative lipid II flippase FtsW [Clostridiales bacterium]|nr:putative lipid II flippase FtsW [Clostridiales bacterium]